jgi:asparagine synthase (glutamine-hydrolysing)
MCGICGEINFNSGTGSSVVKGMMKSMKHRGPDDEGLFINDQKNLVLGFVRLSIIDLSLNAHQPMLSSDARYVLLFNGEVYNYLEIRKELTGLGYSFKSSSDSEVALYSFIEWGEDCLHKFNGMFSFVVYDKKTNILFAARDRFGVKPFYYSSTPKGFLFASEIPALHAALSTKAKVDEQTVYDFLIFNRTDQTEHTFFENIRKLQHGHFLKLDAGNGSMEIKRWYNLSSRLNNPFSSPAEFYDVFSSSCKLRLRSDVPLGVCLSGGLDSSSIISVLLKEHQQNDINTFSAVYNKNETGDESHYIDLFRDRIKNMHFTMPDADSLAKDLDIFIESHGEPVPSTSIYAQYKVCELAKKNVTVVLDGQGADEYLAGYHYFYGYYFKELLKKARYSRLASEIYYYLVSQKSLFGLKTLLFFLLSSKARRSIRSNQYGYVLPEFEERYAASDTISSNLYGSSSLQEALLDHFEFKMEHNLLWNDKNSMHFSLEMREPLLDYRLVERTLATNMDMIINKGFTKAILRDAMKGCLPEEIRLRKDKIGFETPEYKWFRTPYFSGYIKALINDDRFRSRGIIDYRSANDLFEKHLNGKLNSSREIWKFVSLELWYRKFID